LPRKPDQTLFPYTTLFRSSGKTVKKVPLSGWANEAQTTKDGKLILVCIRNTGTKAEDAGALDIIDATTLEKVKSIPVRRGLHDRSEEHMSELQSRSDLVCR